jgi:WD40 repeat protein
MDRTARIWDIASGKAITVLPLHADGVNDASFSPDGTRVVTASRDGTARIWDAATGRMILVLAYHGSSRV